MVVHLTSPDNSRDMLYLRNYATLNVKDQLAKIVGVGQVSLFGSGDYAMRIWLNPDKVAELGLTADDVINAVKAQNVQAAAGIIGGPPYGDGVEIQLPVNAQGRLTDVDEFGDIIIKHTANGVVSKLKDVARIEIEADQYGLRSLLNNQQAVAIPIFQSPGSNAIQISDQVRATMAELKKDMPDGVDYSIVYDPTIFVRGSIKAVVHTLFEALAMVVLVVIVFLQTWRASIIPLLAVPVSIIGTFAIMHMFGFSINALSLFGLVLAIGIVVDDAIVVVENVERNIEGGLSPHDATVQAMKEVTSPIIAITLVLCAVFVPIAFVSGLTGQFYRQFAADYRVLHRHLRVQLAHALARARRHPAQGPLRKARLADPPHRLPLWLVLPRLQLGLQARLEDLRQRRRPHRHHPHVRGVDLSRTARQHLLRLPARAARLRPVAG